MILNERKAKHPLTLLKLYSQYLNGASDTEILNSRVSGILRVSEAQIEKIKLFHTLVSQNKKLLTLSCETGIDPTLAKRMMNLYEQHTRGETVSHCPKRTKVMLSFTLLLDGLSEYEILELDISESDLDSAKRFLKIAPEAEKHLLATIGKQFGIARETVAKMLKIYRDKQAEMMRIEEMTENCIPITA